MLTTDQAAQLRNLIATYAEASVDDSWKGGGDPADVPAIEADLRAAKAKLELFIHQNTEPENEAVKTDRTRTNAHG